MIKKIKSDIGTVSFRTNKKVWRDAEKVLGRIGVSRSQFISIVLREVVRSAKEEKDMDMVDRIKEALLWMGMNIMVRKKE